MGDDDNGMETLGYQLTLGIFLVLAIFNYLYKGSSVYAHLLVFSAVVGVLLLMKGLWDLFFKGELHAFWTGTAICLIIILFFDGLPVVLGAGGLILGSIKYALGVVLA